jgi:hypothetical protein
LGWPNGTIKIAFSTLSLMIFNELPKYVSWSFDPRAIFTDAFTISWSEFKPYIFPPFSLIGKVMLKIMSDKVEKAILIVPFGQPKIGFHFLIPI